jgi:hypothetical protein
MQLYKHNTSRDGTHKQVGGRSVNAALFVEELIEIYSIPTPKGWREAKKVIVLIDCFFSTIAGVQYLYSEPKHESYSNTTHYNSWNKRKHS